MKLILRSPDGRFFEVDEEVVKAHEVKPEDLPAGTLGNAGPGGPQYAGQGPGGPPAASGTGPQVVIYTQGGPGGLQIRHNGSPPPQASSKPDESGVEGRQWVSWDRWGNWDNWPNWGNWGNY